MLRLPLATGLAATCVLVLAHGCGGATPAAPTANAGSAAASPTGTGQEPTQAPPTSNNSNGDGGNTGGQTTAQWPTPGDCINYNPNNLTTKYEAGIWTVNDGGTQVMRLHGGPTDNTGQKGLALAKQYKSHCFIGRNNSRTERYSYIFDYWRNPSGISTTIPDQADDCSPYNRNNLTVDDMGN